MSSSGIVALSATTDTKLDDRLRVRLNAAYVHAIESAGLVPLIVPPLASAADARRVLAAVDGLVLTGGEDLSPATYGAQPHPELGTVNESRDATELALARAARELRLPTLAICRGVQLLNVALGGTLVQDLPSERPGPIAHESGAARDARTHEIDVEDSSRLAALLGATRLRTNSFHHQALDRVADSLRIVARAPDGVIEGVEGTTPSWWLVGVQWHPEDLTETPEAWDRRLFDGFAEAVMGGASSIER